MGEPMSEGHLGLGGVSDCPHQMSSSTTPPPPDVWAGGGGDSSVATLEQKPELQENKLKGPVFYLLSFLPG